MASSTASAASDALLEWKRSLLASEASESIRAESETEEDNQTEGSVSNGIDSELGEAYVLFASIFKHEFQDILMFGLGSQQLNTLKTTKKTIENRKLIFIQHHEHV